MATEKAQLDHVIILLPYKNVVNPPSWITEHFTVSPGGRHADGKTENKLVLFRDGTYVELIAFIDDDAEKRKGHWWDKPYSVVDYALTTTGTEPDVKGINTRLEKVDTGLSYADPREGGRKRPDGVELQWKVTFPKGIERGAIPFWCHDITPRQNRVPVDETSTTHPCGATGMAGVRISVDSGQSLLLNKALAAIVDERISEDGGYTVDDPIEVIGKKPSLRLQTTSEAAAVVKLALIIRTPKENKPKDIHEKVGDGVVEILFEPA